MGAVAIAHSFQAKAAASIIAACIAIRDAIAAVAPSSLGRRSASIPAFRSASRQYQRRAAEEPSDRARSLNSSIRSPRIWGKCGSEKKDSMRTAATGGSSTGDSFLEANSRRHPSNGVIYVHQRTVPSVRQTIKPLAATTALSSRLPNPRFHKALFLEAVQPGIDRSHRNVLSSTIEEFATDRGTVCIFF